MSIYDWYLLIVLQKDKWTSFFHLIYWLIQSCKWINRYFMYISPIDLIIKDDIFLFILTEISTHHILIYLNQRAACIAFPKYIWFNYFKIRISHLNYLKLKYTWCSRNCKCLLIEMIAHQLIVFSLIQLNATNI